MTKCRRHGKDATDPKTQTFLRNYIEYKDDITLARVHYVMIMKQSDAL